MPFQPSQSYGTISDTSPVIFVQAGAYYNSKDFSSVADYSPYVFTTSGVSAGLNSSVSAAPSVSQNNYSPSGYTPGTTNVLQINPSGNISITGITAAPNGSVLAIDNDSTTNTITFTNEDASSAAANQFYCPGQISNTLGPRASTAIRYDGVSSKWRFLS